MSTRHTMTLDRAATRRGGMRRAIVRGLRMAMLSYAALLPMQRPAAAASVSCDFHGIGVGDAATPQGIMAAFGIDRYRLNPPAPLPDYRRQLAQEYGAAAADALDHWRMGPACDASACRIPYGVVIGPDQTPVGVVVALRDGHVDGIDVSISQASWDELQQLARSTYGDDWRVDDDPQFVVADAASGNSVTVRRVDMRHATGGTNPRTRDSCGIRATNYDLPVMHHDPAGPYQALLSIRRSP